MFWIRPCTYYIRCRTQPISWNPSLRYLNRWFTVSSFNLSFGILTRGSVPCYLASLMHLHLSKSSFSQIFQWSHAAHSRPFQSCFQTRFVFEPKAMQSYDHFLNCANFQAFFLKTFFSGRLRRSVGQGRFPFCGCKGTAICRTGKIFHRKNSNKFSQIFTHSWRPTTYTKNFFTCQNRHKKAMCEPNTGPHII